MLLRERLSGTRRTATGPLPAGRHCRSTDRLHEECLGPVSMHSETAVRATTWSGEACHEDPGAGLLVGLEVESLQPDVVGRSRLRFGRPIHGAAAVGLLGAGASNMAVG